MSVASRVGRKPVTVPSGVEVKIEKQNVSIKGPKGSFVVPLHSAVKIEMDNKQIRVASSNEGYYRSGSGQKLNRSIAGTIRAKINNVVHGVSIGYERKLLLVGVGYRAQVKDRTLVLSIGYSHPVSIDAPEGITFETPSPTEVLVKGIDKHIVGHIASIIRSARPPEPYKGKGIRYSDEIVVRKETKKK